MPDLSFSLGEMFDSGEEEFICCLSGIPNTEDIPVPLYGEGQVSGNHDKCRNKTVHQVAASIDELLYCKETLYKQKRDAGNRDIQQERQFGGYFMHEGILVDTREHGKEPDQATRYDGSRCVCAQKSRGRHTDG